MIRVVIAGVGEAIDRPIDLTAGLDPIGLMVAAARAACADAGVAAGTIDAVDVVHQISWRYPDTARCFCERLGIAPHHAAYHSGGGESPIRLIHDAALAIARGERRVSLIVGGEARNTAAKARRAGIDLPWPAPAKAMEHPWAIEAKLHPLVLAHGVAQPTLVYPFYENAWVASRGQSPAEGHRESAKLWARYARVAADNPFAWLRDPPDAATIAKPTAANPLIAYPYTRLMVANPTVNQGAAILLMSENAAHDAGLAADQLVHVIGGAAAKEPDDILARDRYDASPAQDAVLEAVQALAPEGFRNIELYSCFPVVPKMAARTLALPRNRVPTVTGGLTFFGGPFNDYMGHATVAMVWALRSGGGAGLLYGQGDFVTKHHALGLSATLAAAPLGQDYRVDAIADAARGPVPPVVDAAAGLASLETFTILYSRGDVRPRGVAILRTADGARTMARIDDAATIMRLEDPVRSPIGLAGPVTLANDGLLEWSTT